MKTSKPLAIALAAAAALALFTGAVAAPILCRPFYYAHIGPLELEARTGLTREEIKTAFDEMLDYCLGGEEFSTGKGPVKVQRGQGAHQQEYRPQPRPRPEAGPPEKT